MTVRTDVRQVVIIDIKANVDTGMTLVIHSPANMLIGTHVLGGVWFSSLWVEVSSQTVGDRDGSRFYGILTKCVNRRECFVAGLMAEHEFSALDRLHIEVCRFIERLDSLFKGVNGEQVLTLLSCLSVF